MVAFFIVTTSFPALTVLHGRTVGELEEELSALSLDQMVVRQEFLLSSIPAVLLKLLSSGAHFCTLFSKSVPPLLLLQVLSGGENVF